MRRWGAGALGRCALLASLAGCSGPSPTTPRVRIVVPNGATFHQVTDSLVAHDLVSHPLWFRILAKMRGVQRSTQAGTYELPQGQSAWALLTALRAAPDEPVKVRGMRSERAAQVPFPRNVERREHLVAGRPHRRIGLEEAITQREQVPRRLE